MSKFKLLGEEIRYLMRAVGKVNKQFLPNYLPLPISDGAAMLLFSQKLIKNFESIFDVAATQMLARNWIKIYNQLSRLL